MLECSPSFECFAKVSITGIYLLAFPVWPEILFQEFAIKFKPLVDRLFNSSCLYKLKPNRFAVGIICNIMLKPLRKFQ